MPRLMGVVVELTEQARMPSQQTISPYHHPPSVPFTTVLRALRVRTGSPLMRLGPGGYLPTRLSEQTSPRTSLSHEEASCVQSNVSIWLRRSPMVRPERPPAFPPECFRPVLDLVTMSRSRVILALPSLRALRRQPCYFSISHGDMAGLAVGSTPSRMTHLGPRRPDLLWRPTQPC
jgi:hypothetical protein